MLYLTEITYGPRFRVYALSSDTRRPCEEFLEEAQRTDPNEFTKLLARIQRIADHGIPHNEEQCRLIKANSPEEKVIEIKTHKIRLFCFTDKNYVIICANGIYKGSGKVQNQAIATAQQWKAEYISNRDRHQIKIILPEEKP